MFDKATRIEIIFNDNEYIVSNPDEIEQIIRLCRQNWEPSNTHITKEDCDMCVKFIGTDTEVWVDTETLSSGWRCETDRRFSMQDEAEQKLTGSRQMSLNMPMNRRKRRTQTDSR